MAETTLAEHEHGHEHDHGQIDPQLRDGPSSQPASDVQAAIESLNELNATNQAVLEDLNLTGLLERLQQSIKLLIDSNRRQAEIVSSLLVTGRLPVGGQSNESLGALAGALGLGASTIGSALENVNAVLGMAGAAAAATGQNFTQSSGPAGEWVSKTNLDALRQKVRDGSEMNEIGNEEHGQNGDDDKPKKRRKRTMKLEHLVHKIANRRLGVEYTVQGFEAVGTKDLPDPAGDDMIQFGDLFRPDFRADVNAPSVRPYIDTVVEDVTAAWEADFAAREGEQTRDQILRAVSVYWLRLSNRYDEQTARGKGQVHRDEVTRRKQNQYRRQQSLLARRQIAFDQSPLNVCKLRALYRTLLTIDFTPSTTERPEEGRAYTPEEWEVYRRLANNGKPWDAHEIIDLFWMSSTCRGLMNILDVFAADQATRSKRKGRPKAPSPGFHLPPALWDRSKLPTIRPKDEYGLPIEGAAGIVLFKFHVDEQVQLEFPEWAADLYANPPVPNEDSLLPSLPEVMSSSSFAHLRAPVKRVQDQCNLPLLSPEQIAAYQIEMERDGPPQLGIDNDGSGELPDDVGEQLQHLSAAAVSASASVPPDENLESLVALAAASPIRLPDAPSSAVPTGSSLRARRTTKAKASEPPGGAATPVKRKRTDGDDTDDRIMAGLERDHGFLTTL